MGGLVYVVLLGLVIGVLAKLVMPGQVPAGWGATLILGLAGAVVGGFLGSLVGFGDVTGFNVRSLVLGVIGSAVVLWAWPKIAGRIK